MIATLAIPAMMRVPVRNACWLLNIPMTLHVICVLLFERRASMVMVLLCSSGPFLGSEGTV